MRTCIIGGSGFLSGTVAREALAAGHDVTIVTRGKRAAAAGTKAIVADRNDEPAFAAAFSGAPFDLVIDCIGFTAAHARQDLEVFTGRAGHVVFISTDFTLDPSDRPWKIDEAYSRFETKLGYGSGKRAAEEILLAGASDAAARGTRVTILRPCHIYGPGSEFGCLPRHGRDPQLLDRIRRGEPLELVGGGYFLQQPVAAADIARMAFSCFGNAQTAGELYFCAGPDVVDSRGYYRIVADLLGVTLNAKEIPVAEQLREKPEQTPFFCHRVYDMTKANSNGLTVPATPLRDGLAACITAYPVPSPGTPG